MEVVLAAENVTRAYLSGGERVEVLKAVDLEVRKGEFVVLRGSSGSGKTTLLSVLSGLEKPSRGKVYLLGRDITGLSEREMAPLRNSVFGFVFQNFHLIPSLTALENVMFPADLKGDRKSRTKACELLAQVGLAHRKNSFPAMLSGGEQQRVAICRAMINRPALLFADEPTGNLDSDNSRKVADLLIGLCRDQLTTLVLATHSRSLAARADRRLELHNGTIQ